ncbi:MAG: ABC transporter ATP-binding protein [Pirellulaceae bacterium]
MAPGHPLKSISQAASAQSAASIRIDDLTVAYQADTPVLDQVSLLIEAGEIVALVGASGCGKSTLLRAVAGLLQPQQGEVHFDPALSRLSGELSYVFQAPTLLPWRTVDENIGLPLELDRSQGKQPRKLAGRPSRSETIAVARRSVGLEDRAATMFPRELSGGMQMRTSMARALVTDPSVLLLDEPFAALDDILRTKLNELLLQLWASRPRTIIFVTHNIAEAIYLSHRLVVLGKGCVARVIDNELAWPRRAKIRSSLEFAALYGRVSTALAEVSG